MPTERLARAALELHRLALAAAEVRDLPSPVSPRERNAKGAADPTAGTVMDPRRVRLAEVLDRILERVEREYVEKVAADAERLAISLDHWQGGRR